MIQNTSSARAISGSRRSQLLKDDAILPTLFFEDPRNVIVDRHATKIRRPCDPQLTEIDVLNLDEGIRIHRTGKRIARVVTCHRGEHQRRIRYISRHRPLNVVGGKADPAFVRRDKAWCATMRDNTTERSRRPQTTARIRTGTNRCHAGSKRHRRSARGTAANTLRIKGISGHAKDRVFGIGTGTKLRRIGLPDYNGASPA